MRDERIWWCLNHAGQTKEDTRNWEVDVRRLLPALIYGEPEVYFNESESRPGMVTRALLYKTSSKVFDAVMKTHPELYVACTVKGIRFLASK